MRYSTVESCNFCGEKLARARTHLELYTARLKEREEARLMRLLKHRVDVLTDEHEVAK